MEYGTIQDAVAETGLVVRGGFHPGAEDGLPGGAETVVLVGNAGPDLWQHYARHTAGPHPLDEWCRRMLTPLAQSLGADILFPFDGPPYPPFLRWAQRAEGLSPSPIGPMIHPQFGLWHAYRGALAFDQRLEVPDPGSHLSPCESCAEKPCLDTCPVGAFGPREDPEAPAPYDIPACVSHISSVDGEDCLGRGCLARRSCPVGRDYIYGADQAHFHMRRFLKAQGG